MKEPEETVFPAAQACNTGVVIMYASRNERLLGGSEGHSPAQFYRYVLNHDAVHTTIMGLRNVNLFAEVASGLSERVVQTSQERIECEAYGAQLRAAGKLE